MSEKILSLAISFPFLPVYQHIFKVIRQMMGFAKTNYKIKTLSEGRPKTASWQHMVDVGHKDPLSSPL